MKRDRDELNKYLLKQCERLAIYNDKCETIRKHLLEKYNIPTGMTMDMLVRGKIIEQTDHIAYCLLDGISKVTGDKNIIDLYYMPVEIEKYTNTPMPIDKFKFPIVIKCSQVADDQWIGATDTEFFMKLRKAQKINYNENTQRALTKIITKDGEFYRITVDEGTVSGIRKSLQRGEYIPTPITLNIPLESNADFHYDEERGELIIDSIDIFDILDGYHRYVAMFRENDVNPNFNCKWELRIVNFAEDKAKYFIYQEDLKTKMKKIDSNAMNSYNASNRTVNMLNQDSSFGLFGQINNTGGNISAAELSKIVEAFYFKNIKANNENEAIRHVKTDLKNKFNYLLDMDEGYLTRNYTYKDLLAIIYVFKHIDELEKLDLYIKQMVNNLHKVKSTKMTKSREITKSLINDLDEIFKEVQA